MTIIFVVFLPHSSLSAQIYHPHNFLGFFVWLFLFFVHWVQLICPYTHGYEVMHWSMVNLPEAISLKKLILSPPQSHQLSIAPQLEVGIYEPLSDPCWNVNVTILYMSWADNHSCFQVTGAVVLSCRMLFHVGPPWPLTFAVFSHTYLRWFLSLGGSPSCVWVLHSTLYFDHL